MIVLPVSVYWSLPNHSSRQVSGRFQPGLCVEQTPIKALSVLWK